MKTLLQIIKNKYLLAGAFFIVWLLFFDRYDWISQQELRKQLNKLREEKAYYNQEISNNQKSMQALLTDSVNLEKFAREKYLMKKPDEDIFVIVDERNKQDTLRTE